jgi:Fe2+ transport system protein B
MDKDKTKTEIIKDFNEKTKQKTEQVTTSVTSSNDAANDEQEKKTNAEIIKDKAQETKEVREQEKREKEQAKKEEEERANELEKTRLLAQTVQQSAKQSLQPSVNFLNSLPKPGGIGLLILALIFFLLVILPVNKQGDTRLKLLWRTITGQTYLADKAASTGDTKGTSNSSNNNDVASSIVQPTSILPFTTPVTSEDNGNSLTLMLPDSIDFMSLFGLEQ